MDRGRPALVHWSRTHVFSCIRVRQRGKKVYYILRYNRYSQFLDVMKDMLELKNEAMLYAASAERQEFKMKILTELQKLEAAILKIKGKKREKAIEAYRELLGLLREEPIYLKRYE